MKHLLVLILLSPFFISPPAKAAGEALLCSETFLRLPHIAFESFHLKEAAWDKGRWGGEVLYIRRKNLSRAPEKNKDPQHAWDNYQINPDKPGDIRWAAHYLPSSLKRFFSLRLLKNDLAEINRDRDAEATIVTVPNLTEINKGLAILEKSIRQHYPDFAIMNFYSANNAISGRSYLRRIAEEKSLPMSEQGHLFEHDFNYHFLTSLVTPSRVTKALQKRAQIILLFDQFVKQNYQSYPHLESLPKYMKEKFFYIATQRFDFLGNLFIGTMIRPKESSEAQINTRRTINSVLLNASSPKEYLDNLIRVSNMGPLFGGKFNRDFADLYEKFKETLPPEMTKVDLEKKWLEDSTNLVNESREQLNLLSQAASQSL